MNKTTRTMLPLAVLLFASLGTSLPALAQGSSRSVDWQRFDVDLAIQSDGSVNVVETQAIRFTGTYQQGYRLVPLDRTTGVSNISVAEVTDGGTMPYTVFATGSKPNSPATNSAAELLRRHGWLQPDCNPPEG